MDETILVINCGSASIKTSVFAWEYLVPIFSGVEAIDPVENDLTSAYRKSLQNMFTAFSKQGIATKHITAVAHRVVHGGAQFQKPVVIDSPVVASLRECIPLAPLHNPANILGIEVARELLPDVRQVAVFDTAFFSHLPERAATYALPKDVCTKFNIRRYGFHGISHRYVSQCAAEYLDTPLQELRIVSLHLGNGASAAAIQYGQPIDTTMGMTPLEGLVMGTRCGDIDASIPLYLQREAGMNVDEVDFLLQHRSGLYALGGTSDMRELSLRAQHGDDAAKFARDVFAYRVKKTIGAYAAVLGGIDVLIFTGGIGERDAAIREQISEGLQLFGIEVDTKRNNEISNESREIQKNEARTGILVIPTDEAFEIASQTRDLLSADDEA